MCLAVNSRHSLEDLEKWVTEKFSPVVNNEVVLPDLGSPPPYTKDNQSKLIKYVPVKDKDVLSFYWILPNFELEHDSQPLNYFSHLFGHEGENSLLSYLISEGLALELTAGADHELHSFSTFFVEITLTKKGLENYERVVEATFQYAHKLKDVGPQRFVFEECRDLGIMKFEFADKGNAINTCVKLAGKMQKFDDSNIQNLLRSAYVADKFDEQKISQIADELCNPLNLNIYLRSKSLEEECTETEEWYSTKHVIAPFSEALLQKMNHPNCLITHKKLDLPPPNTLIPKNFDILPPNPEDSTEPKLILNEESV